MNISHHDLVDTINPVAVDLSEIIGIVGNFKSNFKEIVIFWRRTEPTSITSFRNDTDAKSCYDNLNKYWRSYKMSV